MNLHEYTQSSYGNLPFVIDTLRGGGAENVFVAFIFAEVLRSWILVRSWMLMVASGCRVFCDSRSVIATVLDSSLIRRDFWSGDNGGGGGPAVDSFPSSTTTTTLSSSSSSSSSSRVALRVAPLSAKASLSSSCSCSSVPSGLTKPSLRSPLLLCMSKLSTDLRTRFLRYVMR